MSLGDFRREWYDSRDMTISDDWCAERFLLNTHCDRLNRISRISRIIRIINKSSRISNIKKINNFSGLKSSKALIYLSALI